ncbi:hypothetical protein [Variovorax paradoxus]|uniref:hypothetical protein n=1 Tax=Variovorax paradoxus TaxID=34073 RepID=UPI0038D06256
MFTTIGGRGPGGSTSSSAPGAGPARVDGATGIVDASGAFVPTVETQAEGTATGAGAARVGTGGGGT